MSYRCDGIPGYDAWKTRSDRDEYPDEEPETEREAEERGADRCMQCGNICPEGDEICGYCAQQNREVEDSVNEGRYE